MDIEKTMKFILESQVRSEQNHARSEQRHEHAMRRMDVFDKQLKATKNLVSAGMKLVIGSRKEQIAYRKEQKENDKIFNYKLNALIDAQQRNEEASRKTDAKIDRLAALLLRKNTNGHR